MWWRIGRLCEQGQRKLLISSKTRRVVQIQSRRTVFVRSTKHKRRSENSNALEDRLKKQRSDRESHLLSSIKKLQEYNATLKSEISQKDDLKAQREAAEAERINLESKSDDSKDVDLLMAGMEEIDQQKPGIGLFTKRLNLQQPILERLGEKALTLVLDTDTQNHNWQGIVNALYNSEKQLSGLTVGDVNQFISRIPLDQRANLIGVIHEMAQDANITPNKLTYDLIISAYAHHGETVVVDSFIDELKASGHTPDEFTYGHLIKSLNKNANLERSVKVVKEMQELGIQPSTRTTTTLLQTCIKRKDYNQAFSLFDMMKFQGTEHQPDVRVYNSVMLAAAKMHDVNRVLDLYNEMQSRAIDPLEPNLETYYTLIYACARHVTHHVQAWKYVLEMRQKQLPLDRKMINMIMYLCGNTGEVSFARALFRQLCSDPGTYPDQRTFNHLLKAYANFQAGFFTPVLASALGNEIRSSFVISNFTGKDGQFHENYTPPMLDMPFLRESRLVMMESRALMDFFQEHHPWIVSPEVVYTFLQIPSKLRSLAEFRKRFYDYTYLEKPDKESAVVPEDSALIPRNHYIYEAAFQACIGMSPSTQALAFATEVWTERGQWRKTEAFKSLSEKERKQSDFLCARSMVTVLAENNEIQEAIAILKSSFKLFDWKVAHVEPLLARLQSAENEADIKLVHRLVGAKSRYKRAVNREYTRVQGERDYTVLAGRRG